jgi:hypothetical protein
LYHGGTSARIIETENIVPQSVLELQRVRNNQVVTNTKNVVNLDRGARNHRLPTESSVVKNADLWNQKLYGGHVNQGTSRLNPKSQHTTKNTSRSRTPF